MGVGSDVCCEYGRIVGEGNNRHMRDRLSLPRTRHM